MVYLPCANGAVDEKGLNLGISGFLSLDNPVNMPVDNQSDLWTVGDGRAGMASMVQKGCDRL